MFNASEDERDYDSMPEDNSVVVDPLKIAEKAELVAAESVKEMFDAAEDEGDAMSVVVIFWIL